MEVANLINWKFSKMFLWIIILRNPEWGSLSTNWCIHILISDQFESLSCFPCHIKIFEMIAKAFRINPHFNQKASLMLYFKIISHLFIEIILTLKKNVVLHFSFLLNCFKILLFIFPIVQLSQFLSIFSKFIFMFFKHDKSRYPIVIINKSCLAIYKIFISLLSFFEIVEFLIII